MSTHPNSHSYFWRHPEQMDALCSHLRRFEPGSSLEVWCAGCAQGEEPYSLAFLLESLGFDFRIIGTDVNRQALEVARLGVYRLDKLRLLPERFRMKPYSEEEREIPERIRSRVEFSLADLQDPEPSPAAFDLVVCRNVLIYFPEKCQSKVLHRLARSLSPNGILMLGYAESSLISIDGLSRLDEHGLFARHLPEVALHSKTIPPVQGENSLQLAIKTYPFGELQQARNLFQLSLEESPNFILGHYFSALIFLELGAFSDAQVHLDSVLSNGMVLDTTTSDFLRERRVSERQFLKSAARVQQRIEAQR